MQQPEEVVDVSSVGAWSGRSNEQVVSNEVRYLSGAGLGLRRWSVRGNLTESWRSLNERPFLRAHLL